MTFVLILQIIAVLIHACAYFVMYFTSHHNKQQSLMSNINQQICFIQATLFTLLILLSLMNINNNNSTSSTSVYSIYSFDTIIHKVSFNMININNGQHLFLFHCCLFVFLSSFANMLEIFYNIELILFLKKPISNFSTRGKLYTIITWLIAVISFIIAYYQDVNNNYQPIQMFIHAKVNLLILSVYVLVSIFSMVYMINFLRSQSRFYSTERKFFGIRFMLYVVVVIVGYGLVCLLVMVDVDVDVVLLVLNVFGIVLGAFRAVDIGKVLTCCVNVRDIEREPILNTVQINTLRESIHRSNTINSGGSSSSKHSKNNFIKKTSTEKITTLLLSTATSDDSTVIINNDTNTSSTSSTTLSMLLQSNVIMEYMFYLLHGINIIADLTYNNKHKKLALTSITSDKFREITIHKFTTNPFTSSSSSQELSVQSQTISNNSIINNLYIWFQMVKGNILLEEHAPKVFRNLFEITNLTLSKIKNSFDPHLNQNVISNITMSEGKSGSFFFFTHDKRYMIKTISQKELDALTGEFLTDYYAHITENRYTFLSKIYGAYTLCYGLSKINIIVMENVAPMKEGEVLLRRFDLKGSVKGRITKNVNLENRKQTLKDLDYLDLKSTFDEGLEFTSDKNLFDLFGVFRNDIRMLCKHGLMDYSFFLTVCRSANEVDSDKGYDEDEDTNSTFVKVHRSKDGKFVYYVGIIDYLTMFDRIKYFEGKIKMFGNKESNLVSSVEPAVYEGRFLRFVWKNVFEIHKNKKFMKRGSFSNFMDDR